MENQLANGGNTISRPNKSVTVTTKWPAHGSSKTVRFSQEKHPSTTKKPKMAITPKQRTTLKNKTKNNWAQFGIEKITNKPKQRTTPKTKMKNK